MSGSEGEESDVNDSLAHRDVETRDWRFQRRSKSGKAPIYLIYTVPLFARDCGVSFDA